MTAANILTMREAEILNLHVQEQRLEIIRKRRVEALQAGRNACQERDLHAGEWTSNEIRMNELERYGADWGHTEWLLEELLETGRIPRMKDLLDEAEAAENL